MDDLTTIIFSKPWWQSLSVFFKVKVMRGFTKIKIEALNTLTNEIVLIGESLRDLVQALNIT